MSRHPGFLVVGAQKCGTTTLYEDLRSHPDIFLPDKESSGLLDPALPADAALARYASLFAASGDRLAGEVSTRYTMLPSVDVSALARQVAADARIIYVVREPVSRAISHHHHLYALRLAGADIDAAVLQHPELVDNGRYAMQIQPWIETFGRSRIHIMRFESFVADRQGEIDRVFSFLGLARWLLPSGEVVHNSATDKVVAVGAWDRLSQSRFYRRRLRPLVSEAARRRVMGAILPKAAPRPPGPSQDTLLLLATQLRADVVRLGELTGDGPWWDLDDVLARERGVSAATT